jgi:DNA-binding FadR family transcriptional regulator
MYNAVVEWLIEQREISGRSPEAGRAAYSAHTRIFKAIAAHDPTEAQNAMQAHLEQVTDFYWAAKRSRQRSKGR